MVDFHTATRESPASTAAAPSRDKRVSGLCCKRSSATENSAAVALRGGIDVNGDGVVSKEEMGPITEATLQEWIDEADDDMRAWTVFCNTHCGWCVDDLTPLVAALEIDAKPFFGPVKRADGVFQLYVELPYHHYLEIDSLTFHGTVGTPSARAWADVV